MVLVVKVVLVYVLDIGVEVVPKLVPIGPPFKQLLLARNTEHSEEGKQAWKAGNVQLDWMVTGALWAIWPLLSVS